jgi:hypothetical protein
MRNQDKNSEIIISDMNQLIKQELFKDKYIKTVLYAVGGVLGLFAIGFVLKAVDISKLWSWTKKGKIDSYGIGHLRYYKKDDLLKSLVLLKVKRA